MFLFEHPLFTEMSYSGPVDIEFIPVLSWCLPDQFCHMDNNHTFHFNLNCLFDTICWCLEVVGFSLLLQFAVHVVILVLLNCGIFRVC